MALLVWLNEVLVGRLAAVENEYTFAFDGEYLQRAERPVLGRAFEDLPPRADLLLKSRGALPAFFRNLLPEGVLLGFLQRAVPQWYNREYHLLRRLGNDLPGAIRITEDSLEDPGPPFAEVAPGSASSLRLALAGIQPKLSVLVDAEKVTVPVDGLGGRWIAKLPAKLQDLPANEHAMLKWARACGMNVPACKLVDSESIEGLPEEFVAPGRALLVERFDRPRSSRSGDTEGMETRIHQEDFSQILGLQPELKYESDGMGDDVNYSTIANIVRRLCGEADFDELLGRLVFMVLSGNGDAHTKNWALTYPDGRHPRLSPAYDLVCTVAYPRYGADLALTLSKELDMTRVRVEHFARLGDAVGADAQTVATRVRELANRAREAWTTVRGDEETPSFVRVAVEEHLAKIEIP